MNEAKGANRAQRRAAEKCKLEFLRKMQKGKQAKKIERLEQGLIARGVKLVALPTDYDRMLALRAVAKRQSKEIKRLMQAVTFNNDFESNQ